MKFFNDTNELNRQDWLRRVLQKLPEGLRLLDAGAGELKNRKYCKNLIYISQDFCQYHCQSVDGFDEGLKMKSWDTSFVDIVSDITAIPEPDDSFDVIMCSEVLEHIPEPTHALDEFSRLLKPGGLLILTAPFSSNVHMAPYFFSTGFSKYWYEHHLKLRGFEIIELTPNGDWYSLLKQEIIRMGGLQRSRGGYLWILDYLYSFISLIFFKLRRHKNISDIACFGWHCLAKKIK